MLAVRARRVMPRRSRHTGLAEGTIRRHCDPADPSRWDRLRYCLPSFASHRPLIRSSSWSFTHPATVTDTSVSPTPRVPEHAVTALLVPVGGTLSRTRSRRGLVDQLPGVGPAPVPGGVQR